jgi:cobalt-zinc-cadmium efflux system outer membrane protein
MGSIPSRAFGPMTLLVLAACQTYQPKPLEPEAILASVDQARRAPDADSAPAAGRPAFTFSRAADLLARHGPALKEARAEYETALALARIATPLPNPGLEVGPQFGFGPGVTSHRVQPFGSINFTIPLGSRLGDQDEMNRLNAELARVEVQARHREAYMELRRQYAAWILSHERLKIREELANAADSSLELSRKLVAGGRLTALEVGLLELEAARTRSGVLDARNDIAELAGDLSLSVGVHADHFLPLPAPALPGIPDAPPDLKALRDRLTANHPELGRLRARYEAAEGELRLEIAKQYPDFTFGPSIEGETGEQKTVLGLALGIELPIFDRNQQGIAVASQRREGIRARYEAAANRALAALERAVQKRLVASQRRDLVHGVLLPKARASLDQVRKAVSAGTADALHVLEAERSQRTTLVEALDAELAAWTAWVDLERAVGCPLVPFPGEKPADLPELTPPSGDPEAHDAE